VTSVPHTTGESARAPAVSVIVCSHDGAQTIARTLASLQRQSLPDERYEVIVVDDGSTDGTGDVARGLGAQVVRLDPSMGLAAARNAGVRAARAEILAFTDDDCEADPGWLAALLEAFSESDAGGVGGPVVPRSTNAFLQGYLETHNPLKPLRAELLDSGLGRRLVIYLQRTMIGEPDPANGALLYSLVGASMAFRRSVLCSLGGFDETFRSAGEDEDICRRAHAQPTPIPLRYAPAARVLHHFSPNVRDGLRRARGYGRANAQGVIKHPDMRPIVFPFPLVMAGLLVGGAFSSHRALLVLGGLMPLAVYPLWVAPAWRSRSWKPVTYPWLEVLRESSTMVGELEGWRAG
jgi:GT2 family glycosyltransferase